MEGERKKGRQPLLPLSCSVPSSPLPLPFCLLEPGQRARAVGSTISSWPSFSRRANSFSPASRRSTTSTIPKTRGQRMTLHPLRCTERVQAKDTFARSSLRALGSHHLKILPIFRTKGDSCWTLMRTSAIPNVSFDLLFSSLGSLKTSVHCSFPARRFLHLYPPDILTQF